MNIFKGVRDKSYYGKARETTRKLAKVLTKKFGDYERIEPEKVDKAYKITAKYLEKIKLSKEKRDEIGDLDKKIEYLRKVKIPLIGLRQFYRGVKEIEDEMPSSTSKEKKKIYKKHLAEIREYLRRNRGRRNSDLFSDYTRILLKNESYIEEQIDTWITVDAYIRLEKYLINQIDKLDNPRIMNNNSPWRSGLFYVFVPLVLLAALITSIIFVGIFSTLIIGVLVILGVAVIGALQLKNDARLKDESFVALMGIVIKRLPIINLFTRKEKEE